MAFWGLEVKPGKQPAVLNLERRLVVKQAALVVAKPDPTPCVLSVSARVAAGGLQEGQPEQSRGAELEAFIGSRRSRCRRCAIPSRCAAFAARRPPHSQRSAGRRTPAHCAPHRPSPPQAAMVTPKQWKIAAALVVGLVVLRGFLDLGIPFMLMHLYYISPKSYLLSMGAAADGKKVVHIKYCVA